MKNADSTTFAAGKKKTSNCNERTASDDSKVKDSIRSDDGQAPTLKVISHQPILLLGHLGHLDNHYTALPSRQNQSQPVLPTLHTPISLPFLQYTMSCPVT